MEHRLISLILVIFTLSAFSAPNSESDKHVIQLQERVQALTSEINAVKSNVTTLSQKVSNLKTAQDSTHAHLDATNDEVASVKNDLSQQALALRDSLNTTNGNLIKTTENLNSRSVFGLLGILCALMVAGLIYCVLRKKIKSGQSAIEAIKEAQKKLNEESIKLDSQLVEIMGKQLDAQKDTSKTTVPQENKSNAIDHSLALKVADEIVRIELNLSRMDPGVRGHKQLLKAVERIKNNFLAQGYEIVDMLGKPYDEGMKVVANFVPDEKLDFGTQIITGITKPQINYNGTMIQAAQITVSQNI